VVLVFGPVPVHVFLPFLFVLALTATLYLSDRMLAVERRSRTVVPATVPAPLMRKTGRAGAIFLGLQPVSGWRHTP